MPLPEPDRTPLARSPLQLVVCQVRFEETLAVSDPKVALAVHERLGGRNGRYRKLEATKATRVDLQVSVAGATVTPSETTYAGWRLSDGDAWTVSLMPDNFALETTGYTTWEADFRERLAELVDAVHHVVGPATEQRLGLRYVDRITYPPVDTPQGWQGFISDEFLGPALHTLLGPSIKTTHQQMALEFPGGIQCLLRHGFFAERDQGNGLTYLLDFDVFRSELQIFDPDDIKQACDQFNTLSLQLFQQATTEKLRELLKEA